MRDALAPMRPGSCDACVTDPPYELSFMGRAWDKSGVAFDPATWAAVFRVLKPGAHLLAFGGTRTHHRIWCAIEDAGFEVRDTIMWVYGQGFPKSLDVSKAIDKAAGAKRRRIRGVRSGVVKATFAQDAWSKEFKDSVLCGEPLTDGAKQWSGWMTQLKPAYEPIVVARKPLGGTVVENVLKYGTGAINVDACRIGTEVRFNTACANKAGSTIFTETKGCFGGNTNQDGQYQGAPTIGRYPANLIHDGSEEVVELFPETESPAGTTKRKYGTLRTMGADNHRPCHDSDELREGISGFGDSGSAARFFYCAKAGRRERGPDNHHPTVKPLALMRYLCQLVTPPGGLLLDPFAGSGTTLLAARQLGMRCVGVELHASHCRIAERRLLAAAAR